MERKENILLIGTPGVGKTHLATAIGIEAAKNRNSTYFINCNDLVLRLKRAHLENRLETRLKFFAKYKLLIIDEVGFLPLDSESSNLLFQLITKRYEKHSTIITTNKSLSRWGGKYLEIMYWQTQYLTDLYTILTSSISQEGPIEQKTRYQW